MAEDSNDRHDGVQIKVWVPEGFYDMLKALAARHQTSVAAEARRLMVAGVEPSEALDTVVEGLSDLNRFLRLHLEPLAFVSAMDSAKSAAYWKRRVYLESHQRGSAKDEAKALMEQMERDMSDQATRRIKRVLREIEIDEIPADSQEWEDDNVDEE
ncbi:hypothetical protein BXT84_00550 [Sulfobacillus thermotolerans]|uniref:Ribbon-helix-helix protein CopG domain-containing protein n=1 Tax=Sulfobacillus thermotolerans TaxID=338644 RepID=A0ABN5GVV2_9FIRM|nr:hypothetical protein BXT84_00550 [Sulfobacillus thermotolerans]